MPPKDFSKYQVQSDSGANTTSTDASANPNPNSKVFQSRNLLAANYNFAERELQISFVSGRTYTYSFVPPEVWTTLRSALDPDAYFRAYIGPTFCYKRM